MQAGGGSWLMIGHIFICKPEVESKSRKSSKAVNHWWTLFVKAAPSKGCKCSYTWAYGDISHSNNQPQITYFTVKSFLILCIPENHRQTNKSVLELPHLVSLAKEELGLRFPPWSLGRKRLPLIKHNQIWNVWSFISNRKAHSSRNA